MQFKVISSNIRFENPADQKHDWPFRKSILSQLINNFSPVVLGTQEGRKVQLLDLEKQLPSLSMIASHRKWIEERMYPSLFYNKAQFKLLKSGDIWLSETPHIEGSSSFESMFPRLATWSHYQIKENGKELFFINCHLDHLKQTTRIEQIKVMITEFNKINSNNLPFIVMGDFNDPPNGLVRKEINQRWPKLIDPWVKLKNPEEASHHDFTGQNNNGSRIDWILHHFDIQCENIFLDKKCKENIYPSDHFLVKAVFTL